jgi:homogentisate 1,2-dioxygenase
MHPVNRLNRAFSHIRGPTCAANLLALSCRSRQTHSVTARSSYITTSTEKDPYQYQVGFGNRFASEAVWAPLLHIPQPLRVLLNDCRRRPGALPDAQNSPQKAKYGLYIEAVRDTPLKSRRCSVNRDTDDGDFLCRTSCREQDGVRGPPTTFTHGADQFHLLVGYIVSDHR